MINPVNLINNQGYVYFKSADNKSKFPYCTNNLQLSGYEAGRAILAEKNICFKQKEALTPIDSVYNQKVNSEIIKTCYEYDSNKKNDTLAYYVGSLLEYYTPSFHTDIDKKSFMKKCYLILDFNTKNDNLNTFGDCYEKQQKLLQIVSDTLTPNTLDSIKEYDIKLQNENFENGKFDEKTKDNNIKIINSVSFEDIKDFINNNMLNKKPYITVQKREN